VDVSFILAVYKARLVHKITSDWKFICLQLLVVTGSREDTEEAE
jgi:hypothetical protein